MTTSCIKCLGNKTYLGIGMIIVDCEFCCGNKKSIIKTDPPTLDKIDRTALSYKTAIKELMKSSKLKRKDAVKLFNETYDKVGVKV